MTDTDFDFDFDVDGGKPSSQARDRASNGSAERDPFDALGDLDDLGKDEFAEEDRDDQGGGGGGVLGLGRRFRPRRYGADR